MRRILVVLCIVTLLLSVVGLSLAKRGAVKIALEPTVAAPAGASGFVIINAPDNRGRYEVLIQVRGLEGGQWVALGVGTGYRVSEFQCNKKGNGHDKVKLDEIGTTINVKALDGPGGNGPTVFTAAIPE